MEEMEAGVAMGQEQCEVLNRINAQNFKDKDCFDGEVCYNLEV